MLNPIETGRIFVRDGIELPESLQIESELYMPGWRVVKNLDGYALGRKIHDARWTFFCLAYETKAAVFGLDAEKMMRRAIERIVANRESEAEKFNSLEIARVAWWSSERFLGIRHLSVSVQSRHIQESPFLFRPNTKDLGLAAPNGIVLRPEQGVEPSKGLPVDEIKKPNLEPVRV
jgi:hypothetical protein